MTAPTPVIPTPTPTPAPAPAPAPSLAPPTAYADDPAAVLVPAAAPAAAAFHPSPSFARGRSLINTSARPPPTQSPDGAETDNFRAYAGTRQAWGAITRAADKKEGLGELPPPGAAPSSVPSVRPSVPSVRPRRPAPYAAPSPVLKACEVRVRRRGQVLSRPDTLTSVPPGPLPLSLPLGLSAPGPLPPPRQVCDKALKVLEKREEMVRRARARGIAAVRASTPQRPGPAAPGAAGGVPVSLVLTGAQQALSIAVSGGGDDGGACTEEEAPPSSGGGAAAATRLSRPDKASAGLAFFVPFDRPLPAGPDANADAGADAAQEPLDEAQRRAAYALAEKVRTALHGRRGPSSSSAPRDSPVRPS